MCTRSSAGDLWHKTASAHQFPGDGRMAAILEQRMICTTDAGRLMEGHHWEMIDGSKKANDSSGNARGWLVTRLRR